MVTMYLLLVGYGACTEAPHTPESAQAPKSAAKEIETACGVCHPAAEAAWAQSHHALAQRPIHADKDPGLKMGQLPDGQLAAGAIGVHPLVQYLVPAKDGRTQAHELAWHVDSNEWFLTHSDARQQGDWGHWTGRGMNWNSQCAVCHVTEFSKGYNASSDSYTSVHMGEGVGCESCHVDAAAHLADIQHKPSTVTLDTCAPCHSERSQLTATSSPNGDFTHNYLPRVPDLTDGWYASGQAHDEVFEWASFVGSKMHVSGVGCGDCHEPHSGKLISSGDALCTECHGKNAPLDAGHSHHGDAVACVDCHMPERTYMERHPRRDHGFLIPDPILGRHTNSPDACTGCHANLPRPDVERAWLEWFGTDHRERRQLPLALHAARSGDSTATAALLNILGSGDRQVHRSTAALALAPWGEREDVHTALRLAAADPSSLVRLGAVQALAEAVATGRQPSGDLRDALRDSSRAVRVAAGKGLQGLYPPDAKDLADYRAYLATNLDQPGPRHDLGAWYMQHGELAKALPLLESAMQWDPGSALFKYTYALALSRTDRLPEAIVVLESAVALAPDEAAYWHALGIAYGVPRANDAARALRTAVRIAPEQSRYSRSLSLVLHAQAKSAEAIRVAREGLSTSPDDVSLRWALATILRDTGAVREAHQQAVQILSRDPQHRGARDLSRLLENGYGRAGSDHEDPQ